MIAHIRTDDYKPIAPLVNRTDLEHIERLWAAGGWSYTVPTNTREGDLLLANPGYGLQLTEDDRVVAGGPYRTHQVGTSDTNDTVTVAGVDDHGMLAGRFCWPNPATSPTSWNAATKHTVTGQASTVLRTLFDSNAGPSAQTARRIPNLALDADPAEGATITAVGNGQTLLEAFNDYGQSPAMVCRLRQTTHGTVTFTVRAARDRTNVVFSPLNGTIESYARKVTAPTATHVVVSDGAGSFIEQAAPASSWFSERIERFVDASGEASLSQYATNYLAENAEQLSLTVVPVANPAAGRSLRYGIDFDLGDLITLELPEGRSIAQLTTTTISQADDIDRRTFTVGEELVSPNERIRGRAARIEAAVRRLQRN